MFLYLEYNVAMVTTGSPLCWKSLKIFDDIVVYAVTKIGEFGDFFLQQRRRCNEIAFWVINSFFLLVFFQIKLACILRARRINPARSYHRPLALLVKPQLWGRPLRPEKSCWRRQSAYWGQESGEIKMFSQREDSQWAAIAMFYLIWLIAHCQSKQQHL